MFGSAVDFLSAAVESLDSNTTILNRQHPFDQENKDEIDVENQYNKIVKMVSVLSSFFRLGQLSFLTYLQMIYLKNRDSYLIKFKIFFRNNYNLYIRKIVVSIIKFGKNIL